MHVDDAARRHALGLGGAHVVGSLILQQVRPRQTRHIGHRQRSQHQARQDELTPRSVAGRHREPPESQAEDELGQRTDDEDRDGDDDQGGHEDEVVDELAASHTGPYTGQDADDDLDEHGDESQLDRHGVASTELGDDGVAVVVNAEIAVQQLRQVQAVLDEEWLVEVVLGSEGRDIGGRTRTFTTSTGRRVARQGEDQTEDDERRPDEHRDHLKCASDDISEHGVPHDTVGPLGNFSGPTDASSGMDHFTLTD